MATATWGALCREGRAAPTILLTLSVGIHAIDVFIIATVLPSVVEEIGGAAFYAWSTMLYVVASILGAAGGGLARARWDVRRSYTLGTVLFLVGSLGCALASSMAWLLLARGLQGLGGGMLMALSYGMVGELYPESLRPRMFSLISGMWGAAALLGPSIGGIFAALGWWRGAFWSALPVIGGLAALAWLTLPATTHPRLPTAGRPPWQRLTLLGLGVLAVAWSGQVGGALAATRMVRHGGRLHDAGLVE
ncbi:MAG: MFS transporter [Candidatus Tectomicrobia bacterium]|uniref:MFS transporter n=1 Tax=Tectimicrobiota bacterium TaxID=2528274 RepID=A0A937W241_UNCTE|nr:MFS transporter [Candidatus Tectomicrobia bacterium]